MKCSWALEAVFCVSFTAAPGEQGSTLAQAATVPLGGTYAEHTGYIATTNTLTYNENHIPLITEHKGLGSYHQLSK